MTQQYWLFQAYQASVAARKAATAALAAVRAAVEVLAAAAPHIIYLVGSARDSRGPIYHYEAGTTRRVFGQENKSAAACFRQVLEGDPVDLFPMPMKQLTSILVSGD